jgi:hypothetical protein
MSSGDSVCMTARCPRCNSARRDGQAWPAGRRPVCPAPSLVRAARRDHSSARVQARHVPPSRSFCTRRSLPTQPPLDRRDPTPPQVTTLCGFLLGENTLRGGRRAPARRGGGTPPARPRTGPAPNSSAPDLCPGRASSHFAASGLPSVRSTGILVSGRSSLPAGRSLLPVLWTRCQRVFPCRQRPLHRAPMPRLSRPDPRAAQ